MKHLNMNSKRLLGIMFLFGAVGSLMITTPLAFATSPIVQGVPVTGIVKNSQGTIEVKANSFGNDIQQILILEHNPANSVPVALIGNVCPPVFNGADPAARQWVLQVDPTDPSFAGAGTFVGMNLAANVQGKASVPFGPSAGSFTLSAADLTNPGVDTWTVGTTPGILTPYSPVATVKAYWGQITPVVGAYPADDTASTATAGVNWRVVACGSEGADPITSEQWQGKMVIILPVGGTVLPVNTVSLFVAGISNSAFLLLPLAGVAVGAFAILRHQVNNKEDKS